MTNQWVSIESAPKDGTRILVVNEDGEIDVAEYVAAWQEHQEFVRKAKDGDVFRTVVEDTGYWNTERAYCPTHWQPLPIPPLARKQA
jgi:hypothetical protein